MTVFVLTDDLMQMYEHHSDFRSRVSDSEIVTVAICAANSVKTITPVLS